MEYLNTHIMKMITNCLSNMDIRPGKTKSVYRFLQHIHTRQQKNVLSQYFSVLYSVNSSLLTCHTKHRYSELNIFQSPDLSSRCGSISGQVFPVWVLSSFSSLDIIYCWPTFLFLICKVYSVFYQPLLSDLFICIF